MLGIEPDERSLRASIEFGDEAQCKISPLEVGKGFFRHTLDVNEELDADMLVMKRLYPMDFRAYDQERRLLWLDVFAAELAALHAAGFAHRDLRRPSDVPGLRYDNIFLTDRGLRLIDVGMSALRKQVGERLLGRFVERELAELALFGEEFLAR